jgi:FkbM family methyltransferase
MEPILLKKDKLLQFVKQYIPQDPIIVEAGAFNGNDTLKLHQQWPHASIHAFEPVPEIFALLEENTKTVSCISRYNCALSNAIGFTEFHVSENPKKPGAPFPAGSIHAPKERLQWSDARYTKIISVPTITLDAWADNHGVDRIDFLWLDLQGHALPVLQAAERILSRTIFIYTEVEFIEAYAHQALYPEIRSWLEAHNFTMIAQDFTDQTSWFFGNVLFVHNGHPLVAHHIDQ